MPSHHPIPGLNDAEIKALTDLYTTAAERIREMVLRPTGKTDPAREWNRGRASQQIEQVDQMLIALGKRTGTWVGKAVPEAMVRGLEVANKQAVAAGVAIPGDAMRGSFAMVNHGAAKIFARDIAGDLGKARGAMRDRADRLLRATSQHSLTESKINTILAGGILEGTPRQTIRQLREEFRAVSGDTISINDREYPIGYYAELVARTRTAEASIMAQHDRLSELDIDLVVVMEQSDACDVCAAFRGQVFSLSGKSDKYPAYDSLPDGGLPFHPHCRGATGAFIEALATEKQLKDAVGPPDVKKLLGTQDEKGRWHNKSQTDALKIARDLQIRQQMGGQATSKAHKAKAEPAQRAEAKAQDVRETTPRPAVSRPKAQEYWAKQEARSVREGQREVATDLRRYQRKVEELRAKLQQKMGPSVESLQRKLATAEQGQAELAAKRAASQRRLAELRRRLKK